MRRGDNDPRRRQRHNGTARDTGGVPHHLGRARGARGPSRVGRARRLSAVHPVPAAAEQPRCARPGPRRHRISAQRRRDDHRALGRAGRLELLHERRGRDHGPLRRTTGRGLFLQWGRSDGVCPCARRDRIAAGSAERTAASAGDSASHVRFRADRRGTGTRDPRARAGNARSLDDDRSVPRARTCACCDLVACGRGRGRAVVRAALRSWLRRADPVATSCSSEAARGARVARCRIEAARASSGHRVPRGFSRRPLRRRASA
jgi:hypothetical protein